MVEFLGTMLAFVAKWYKSSRKGKHRYRGFTLTLFVQAYWAIYFLSHNMWWLAFYNVVSATMAIRGIVNNKSKNQR